MEVACGKWGQCYGQIHVLEGSRWTQGGQVGGVTQPRHSGSGSDIGESHVRGRKSRKGGRHSSPALHPRTAPIRLMDFQTKSGMAHLAAKQSAAQLPWCFSLALLSPSGPPSLPPTCFQPSGATPGPCPLPRNRDNSENQTEATPSCQGAPWK